MLRGIHAALNLLTRRAKFRWAALIAAQMALALLDLIGVLLIGYATAVAASSISGGTPQLPGPLSGLDAFSPDTTTLILLAVLAGVLFILKSVGGLLLIQRSYKFLAHRQSEISSKLAHSVLTGPIGLVRRRSSQEMAYALTVGVNSATIGVLGGASVIASELAVLALLFVTLVILSPLVALATTLFFFLLTLLLYRILGGWANKLGRSLATTDIASITSVQNAARMYREIWVAGSATRVVEQFTSVRQQAALSLASIAFMGQISKYVFEIALVAGGGVLALSQFSTRTVSEAAATTAVFLVAATRIMPSLLRLQQGVLGIRSGSGNAASTFLLADEARDESTNYRCDIAGDFAVPYANINLDNATYCYPGNVAPTVSEVSLQIPSGRSMALVGPSGAGKSTLLDLILGVSLPDSGSVSVGGIPAAQVARGLPGFFAFVPQEVIVVEGTIRTNVAIGFREDGVGDEDIWGALRLAQLDGFVTALPDGLDTPIGENGLGLSGGQKQRLGLARAFLGKPKILILDEATSALDAETESMIVSVIEELRGEVTTLVVAHRLATVVGCDQIAYMENGRICAVGTFGELLDSNSGFRRQAELLGMQT